MTDYSAFSDTRLVLMARCGTNEGDDAFCELVTRYKNLILYAATTILPDIHAAEDIAQDTFIDGYLQLARLCEPEKFAPWMYGIAKRKALHYITRRKTTDDIDEYSELIPSLDASPEDAFVRRETTKAVREAVEKLSDKNRAAAVLFYFDNLSVSAIARRLSIPEGTVKSRLFDARRQLKLLLENTHEEESAYMGDKKLSGEFDEKLRRQIDEIKNYYRNNGKSYDGFDSLFTTAESIINALPESREKHSALAEIYLARYYQCESNEVRQKLIDNAHSGENPEIICEIRIDELIKGDDYESWIKRLDGEFIPEFDKDGYQNGKGKLLFWRGCADIHLKRIDDAKRDFTQSEKLCEKSDVYHALSVTGLKVIERLTKYADDPYTGFHVTAESYQIDGSKLRFMSQPGFSSGNEVLYERHKMTYLNYYISRFDDLFYDTEMEIGRVYQSREENSTLTLLGYDGTAETAAGRFENCMHICYDAHDDYTADVYYAKGIGMVKVAFTGRQATEEYELSEYEIHGGDGYFPFCIGNRWNYIKPDLPDYLYQSFENQIDWTDGITANFTTIHIVSLKKDYMTNYQLDSDMYIANAQKLCEDWKTDEAVGMLRLALRENSSQNSAMIALSGIEYLTRFSEYQKKSYRFCPSSYN